MSSPYNGELGPDLIISEIDREWTVEEVLDILRLIENPPPPTEAMKELMQSWSQHVGKSSTAK
jgi:hypothetical protein